jgi:sulfite exporter TauE/SafE
MIAGMTGLLVGAVHVWSGPDHLAAIAPLAARRNRRAWVPGVRWGLGHSTGVALVGLLSLWLREALPIDLLSQWGERIVGVMLFGVGIWGLRTALNIHVHEHEHDGERHVHLHTHTHRLQHDTPDAHHHGHAAFGIGILHGLAGSSHFLGVLPVLAFPTRLEAAAYLVAFGVGTVASMAAFSWMMGRLAGHFEHAGARSYRRLLGSSAVLTMGVGAFWLATSLN